MSAVVTDVSTTYDDGSREYPHPATGEMIPSVTTYLSATSAKPWLTGWSAGLAAEYAVDNLRDLSGLRQVLGRAEAVGLAKRQSELIRNRKRDVGGFVHKMAEAMVIWQFSPEGHGADLVFPELPGHLAGTYYDDEPVEEVAEWMQWGFLNFVSDFQPEFATTEMTVYNRPMRYAGTLDLIATLPGLGIGRAGRFVPGNGVTPCIDIKTGKHLDATVPEQVAAYRRATEAATRLGQLFPMPATDCAAVLHLRPEYANGYRLMMVSGADDAAAWNRFRRAVELYEGRKAAKKKPGKVCYPLRADGTIPQPRIADLDGEGYGRTLSPLAKAGIADLEQLAAMTAGDLLKTKGIGGKTVEGARILLADHGLHLKGEELAPVLQVVRETAGAAA